VASFLHYVVAATDKLLIYLFSSLSESGFIPTSIQWPEINDQQSWFSSLSESGFIPTKIQGNVREQHGRVVLISFREWLHSYKFKEMFVNNTAEWSSHLFQRVASFLLRMVAAPSGSSLGTVLISFREWLHSYNVRKI